jgi:hypothetical protein
MMKVCNKCGKAKPATPEYFVKDKRNKDGLYGWCKECKRQDTADRFSALSSEQKDIYNENHAKRKRGNPIRTAFQGKRSRAKALGIEWGLGESGTPEEDAWIERMECTTHCPDCSCEIKWYQRGARNKDSGSFDRIDSNIGYVEGNVRITCTGCNTLKSYSPVDEWVGLLEVRIEKGIIACIDEALGVVQ